MRKKMMKLASVTLCFAVAAVMLVACGDKGDGLQRIDVDAAPLANLSTLSHNSGGNAPAGSGISYSDYWANSYVVSSDSDNDLYAYFVKESNRNAQFKIEANDDRKDSNVLTAFSVEYDNEDNNGAARLYLFDEGYPDDKVVMYDLLQQVSALEGTDYTAYSGSILGRSAGTEAGKSADERKLNLHFAAEKTGTYLVTMHLVEIESAPSEGKVNIGDSLTSHTIKFVVS